MVRRHRRSSTKPSETISIDTCHAHPELDALVVRHQNVRWSYKVLQQHVNQLAAGLVALGVEPGDPLGIWGPNSVEWAMVQLATAKVGAIMVCINPAYRTSSLSMHSTSIECGTLISRRKFQDQ